MEAFNRCIELFFSAAEINPHQVYFTLSVKKKIEAFKKIFQWKKCAKADNITLI